MFFVELPSEQPTLASLLKNDDYDTALFGEWHCGYPLTYSPWQSSFNEFFRHLSSGIDYFRHVAPNGLPALLQGQVKGSDIRYEQVTVEGYATDLFTDRAVEFLKRARDRPFYLSLHYNAPHGSFQYPDDKALSNELVGRDSVENWINNGTAVSYTALMKRLDRLSKSLF